MACSLREETCWSEEANGWQLTLTNCEIFLFTIYMYICLLNCRLDNITFWFLMNKSCNHLSQWRVWIYNFMNMYMLSRACYAVYMSYYTTYDIILWAKSWLISQKRVVYICQKFYFLTKNLVFDFYTFF